MDVNVIQLYAIVELSVVVIVYIRTSWSFEKWWCERTMTIKSKSVHIHISGCKFVQINNCFVNVYQ